MAFSREISDQAKKLHYDSVIVDGCSFFLEGYNENLKVAGVTALNLTIPFPADGLEEAIKRIADCYHVVNRDPNLRLIEAADDIAKAKAAGQVGVIIGAQNARQLQHDYLGAMVETFYRLGLRVAILSYNGRNFAADGCISGTNGGLSREGQELVRQMNRVGVVIDCSHTAERSTLDAIELSEHPCVFTHSNPKSRSDMPRNVTDEQMKKLAGKGGVVGLTPFGPLNWGGGDEPPTMDDFLDNIEYVLDLVGDDHVGIGTDKEGTPGAYPRELIMREISTMAISVGDYFSKFAGNPKAISLDGFKELYDFPIITQGLLDRGVGEESIRKILGLNFVRVFEQVWK